MISIRTRKQKGDNSEIGLGNVKGQDLQKRWSEYRILKASEYVKW